MEDRWKPAKEKPPMVGYLQTLKDRIDFAIDLILRQDLKRLETLKRIMEQQQHGR